MTFRLLKNHITNIEREYCTKANSNLGLTATNDCLREQGDLGSTTHVIFIGKWTPYGYCRDCGDHWIIARWSRYDRIDKDTYKVTKDVDDR